VGVELGLRAEQRRAAPGAAVGARRGGVPVGPGEGTLGPGASQHLEPWSWLEIRQGRDRPSACTRTSTLARRSPASLTGGIGSRVDQARPVSRSATRFTPERQQQGQHLDQRRDRAGVIEGTQRAERHHLVVAGQRPPSAAGRPRRPGPVGGVLQQERLDLAQVRSGGVSRSMGGSSARWEAQPGARGREVVPDRVPVDDREVGPVTSRLRRGSCAAPIRLPADRPATTITGAIVTGATMATATGREVPRRAPRTGVEAATEAGELLLGFAAGPGGRRGPRRRAQDQRHRSGLRRRRRRGAGHRHLVADRPARRRHPRRGGAGPPTGHHRPLTWVVDPLDGTVNFLYGWPLWCVSIACVDAEGTLAGAIVQPDQGRGLPRGPGAGRLARRAALARPRRRRPCPRPGLHRVRLRPGRPHRLGPSGRRAARPVPGPAPGRAAALDLVLGRGRPARRLRRVRAPPWDWAAGRCWSPRPVAGHRARSRPSAGAAARAGRRRTHRARRRARVPRGPDVPA
jgi:myo-inositol-1(or 4)-monophosphatase